MRITLPLLIDEGLSPELVQFAVVAGHVASPWVHDRGRSGVKDWKLVVLAVEGDDPLVTHNAVNFRGGGPGRLGGQHAKQPIHAGPVCLNSALVTDLECQRDLFALALEEFARLGVWVDQAPEMFELEGNSVKVVLYDVPASD